jgi:hypothetical protein
MVGNRFLLTAVAFLEKAASGGLIFLERFFLGKAIVEGFEETFVDGAAGGCERVKGPEAAFFNLDEAGFAKMRKVARDGGLGGFEDSAEIADAHFLLAQEDEQAQARGVGEGAEFLFGGGHDGLPPSRNI